MRIIKKFTSEVQRTCKKCTSVIGILPSDIHTVSGPGYYDMDYDDDVGKKYWNCPVCKVRNLLPSSSDDHDDS